MIFLYYLCYHANQGGWLHMNDVLLVDDERAVLGSLLSALDWAEFGFTQVRTAQSAQEAIRMNVENIC